MREGHVGPYLPHVPSGQMVEGPTSRLLLLPLLAVAGQVTTGLRILKTCPPMLAVNQAMADTAGAACLLAHILPLCLAVGDP